MKDDKTGKWVGFYSYMAYGCDLHTWTSNSMIVSAIADEPDGVSVCVCVCVCVGGGNRPFLSHHVLVYTY